MRKFPRPKPLWKLYVGPVAMLLAAFFFPFAAKGDYSYLIDLGRLCGIYVIIVAGLTLLMGYTGQVSLGHAGFYAMGAYIPAVLVMKYDWPMYVAIAVGIVVTALLSYLIAKPLLKLKGNHLALATLAVGIIIGQTIYQLPITGAADGMIGLPEINPGGVFDAEEFSLMGTAMDGNVLRYFFVWAIVTLCIVWAVQLIESPAGRGLRAVEGDEEAAQSLGIDTMTLKIKVFVASAVLAAIAGSIYAFVHTQGYLGPAEFGLWTNVKLVMMVVIGGMGSIWGSVAGGVLLTGLHEVIDLVGYSAGLIDTSRIEHTIFGVLLALILIVSPSGLIPGLKNAGMRALSFVTPKKARP